MVGEFCADRAAVNMLGRTVGARVTVLDVGGASSVPAHPRLERGRVLDGTADLHEALVTRDEAARAVRAGAQARPVIPKERRSRVDGRMGLDTTPAGA